MCPKEESRTDRESLLKGDFEGTVVGHLLSRCGMEERYAPNMLLAVLWASLANTLPAAFWSTAFLLLPEQATWREAVISSCREGLPEGTPPTSQSAEKHLIEVRTTT